MGDNFRHDVRIRRLVIMEGSAPSCYILSTCLLLFFSSSWGYIEVVRFFLKDILAKDDASLTTCAPLYHFVCYL